MTPSSPSDSTAVDKKLNITKGPWSLEVTPSEPMKGARGRRGDRTYASIEVVSGELVHNGKRVDAEGNEYPLYRSVLTIHFDDTTAPRSSEVLANCQLIAEAGTIANSTDCSPKTLLEQRDKAVELLRDALVEVVENASRHRLDSESFEGSEFAMCIANADIASKKAIAIKALLSSLSTK